VLVEFIGKPKHEYFDIFRQSLGVWSLHSQGGYFRGGIADGAWRGGVGEKTDIAKVPPCRGNLRNCWVTMIELGRITLEVLWKGAVP